MSTKQRHKKDVYECEYCGATAPEPTRCCGKPMQKKPSLETEE